MSAMTIGALAEGGAVGVETVRYYQRRNLLRTPPRSGTPGHGSTVRRYDQEDLRRLSFIRSAQSAGFSLEEIRELLELDPARDRARAQSLAAERIASLDARIAELEAMRATLAHLHHSCMSDEHGPCPILTAFDVHSRR